VTAAGPPPALASTRVVGRRLGAAALDAALLAAVVAAVFVAGATTAASGEALGCADLQDSGGASSCLVLGDTIYSYEGAAAVRFWAVAVAVWVTFYAALPALLGGSLGKLLTGLRVVDRFGSPAGFGRHLGRGLLFGADGFPYCFPVVGVAMIAASTTHQRAGDRVAGTFVVAASDVGRPVIAVPIATPSLWAPPATAAPQAPTPWSPPGLPASQAAPTWRSEPTWGSGPQGATTTPIPPAPEPQPSGVRWDERWNAWLYWDAGSQRWLRHDPATNQWIPI
jgi:uncharacterized RDD family membrane protein YckC